MTNQQPVRTICMDCAMPIFVLAGSLPDTRCPQCSRKYGQQLYLLSEFLMRL